MIPNSDRLRKEETNMMMQARSQRLVVLTLALMLVWSVLAATLLAPAASASEVNVRDLVIRSITLDPQTKVATARGAVTCTGASRAFVGVEVSQTVGRLHTVYAYGDKRIDCDGRERFSIRLTNAQGRLGPGEATVQAGAEAFTRFDYDFAFFSGVLQVSNAK
jgi:hypothetical protein